MKLPSTEHTSRPWRIHEFTRDFRLEDVWALPTPGAPDEFARLVSGIVSDDFPRGSSLLVRALWGLRWKIGALLGWDRPEAPTSGRPRWPTRRCTRSCTSVESPTSREVTAARWPSW